MAARPFSLQPGDDGPLYEGPHGPLVLSANQDEDATRMMSPQGEARLAWGMLSRDRAALQRGVSLHIGRRDLSLRRVGRSLEVQDAQGRALAIVRRRRLGRVVVERPDGDEVAWFKPTSLSGEVDEAASADEVVLLLLMMGSNAGATLERGIPLLSPFGSWP